MNFAVPNHIKYWINSIPKPSCALFSSCEDLRSGTTLKDIVLFAENGKTIPHIDSCTTFTSVARCVLNFIGMEHGWGNLPSELRAQSAADLISRGQPEETLWLLEILYRISTGQSLVQISSPHPPATKYVAAVSKQITSTPPADPTPQASTKSKTNRSQLNTSITTPSHTEEKRRISFGENSTRFIPSASDEQDAEDDFFESPPLDTSETPKEAISSRRHSHVDTPVEHHESHLLNHSEAIPGRLTHVKDHLRKDHQSRNRDKIIKKPMSGSTLKSAIKPYSSMNNKDVDLVFGAGSLSEPEPVDALSGGAVSSEDRMTLIRWLDSIGIIARPPPDTSEGVNLDDEWSNGVLLSQLAAICSRGNRKEVKEVASGPTVKVLGGRGSDGNKRVLIRGSYDTDDTNRTQRPRLMLVGTDLSVRSRAQAVRNVAVSLKALSSHSGLEDLELIIPQDLISGRRSLWPVLMAVYKACGTRLCQQRGYEERGRLRSKSAPRHPISHSRSPTPPPPPSSPGKATCRNPPIEVIKADSRQSIAGTPSVIKSARISSKLLPACRQDPGYIARRSIRSASPPKRAPSRPAGKENVASNPSTRRPKSSMRKKSGTIKSEDGSLKERENGWDSSWNQHDRDTVFELDKPLSEEVVKPIASSNSRDRGTIVNNSRRGRTKREGPKWQPPRLSERDEEAMQAENLPPILPPQLSVIKDWLYTLGISVRDGEGGFINWYQSSAAALPDLKDDRLRNGEILCELVALLEPNAARHAQLIQLVNRRPSSISSAMENIERALWLLRIRKCPPIPQVYLCQPKAILEAKKTVLWGLLDEIMRAYPLKNGFNADAGVSLITDQSISKVSNWPRLLPYSIADRKALDQSLMHWLVEEEVLSGIMKGLLPSDMPSIATLEGPLRDGTILCLLAGKILGAPVMGWHRKAKSYSVSVANLRKCLQALRGSSHMSTRFLYTGVEEDIAKGEWAAILGLLEDMHRLRDGVPPVKRTPGDIKDSKKQRPYLGQEQQEWPPPLDSGDFLVSTASVEPKHGLESVGPRMPSFDSTVNLSANPLTRGIPASDNTAGEPHWKGNSDLFPGGYKRVRDCGPENESKDYNDVVDVDASGSCSSNACDIIPVTTAINEASDRNQVHEMRIAFQNRQMRAPPHRYGDVIPSEANSDGEVPRNESDSISGGIERYTPPDWSAVIKDRRDIAPDASNVPGGLMMSKDRKAIGSDINPSKHGFVNADIETPADDHLDWALFGEKENLENVVDTKEASVEYGFRGAPRPAQLRVQATISREDSTRTPSPVKRMREKYVADESKYREKHNHSTTDVFDHPEPPPWVQKMMPPISAKDTGKQSPYDDSISMPSTPPTKLDKSSLRLAAAGVLDSKHMKSAATAFRWLTRLGLVSGMPPYEVGDNGQVTMPSLSDGVLLGKLLQHLERSSSLPGFTEKPKCRAQRLQNIRKVLGALSKNKQIPLSALSIEEDILSGRVDSIVELILRIRDVYKFHKDVLR